MKSTPSGSTATTAIALTPPQVATTRALSAAARRTEPRSLAYDERQQHPRRQRHRPELDGDSAEQRRDPRGEHERERRQHLGAGRAEVELAGQPEDPEERQAQQQRPPEPLDDPRRQPDQLAHDEERPHRPGVAVGLVLQLAERRGRVPHLSPVARKRRGPVTRSNLVSATIWPEDWAKANAVRMTAYPAWRSAEVGSARVRAACSPGVGSLIGRAPRSRGSTSAAREGPAPWSGSSSIAGCSAGSRRATSPSC